MGAEMDEDDGIARRGRGGEEVGEVEVDPLLQRAAGGGEEVGAGVVGDLAAQPPGDEVERRVAVQHVAAVVGRGSLAAVGEAAVAGAEEADRPGRPAALPTQGGDLAERGAARRWPPLPPRRTAMALRAGISRKWPSSAPRQAADLVERADVADVPAGAAEPQAPLVEGGDLRRWPPPPPRRGRSRRAPEASWCMP